MWEKYLLLQTVEGYCFVCEFDGQKVYDVSCYIQVWMHIPLLNNRYRFICYLLKKIEKYVDVENMSWDRVHQRNYSKQKWNERFELFSSSSDKVLGIFIYM